MPWLMLYDDATLGMMDERNWSCGASVVVVSLRRGSWGLGLGRG
jgi:hypothetical protein